eukprot:TRINITY_DN19687_c0_g1_i2.p1 TRINITY_DN19687_c0_g1~~TRINITY_DN19687_c0_g1_i2.p1  ORF type:complete len:263 (-),score=34.63 TRINITY_DN19687_c0_g1_i2:57-800(-)
MLPVRIQTVSRISEAARPRILVTGSVGYGEALAAIEIFKLVCQEHMEIEIAVMVTLEQMEDALPFASYMVVLLSQGLLRDPLFARMLLSATANIGGSSLRVLELVTVNSDDAFEFPNVELFCADLRQNGLGVPGLGVEVGPQLANSYRTLLNAMALPLSPLGSEGLLFLQVSEICRRFHRYEDVPQGQARDSVIDKALDTSQHIPQGPDMHYMQSEADGEVDLARTWDPPEDLIVPSETEKADPTFQ